MFYELHLKQNNKKRKLFIYYLLYNIYYPLQFRFLISTSDRESSTLSIDAGPTKPRAADLLLRERDTPQRKQGKINCKV